MTMPRYGGKPCDMHNASEVEPCNTNVHCPGPPVTAAVVSSYFVVQGYSHDHAGVAGAFRRALAAFIGTQNGTAADSVDAGAIFVDREWSRTIVEASFAACRSWGAPTEPRMAHAHG